MDDEGVPFFQVQDLKLDERFANIPLVTGQPYLRYYGGTPLYAKSGIAIGALVVVDNKPRKPLAKSDQMCECFTDNTSAVRNDSHTLLTLC